MQGCVMEPIDTLPDHLSTWTNGPEMFLGLFMGSLGFVLALFLVLPFAFGMVHSAITDMIGAN